MFKEKNLLVLSHTYNSFIKDPVEILSQEFNRVYVLVRYQPIAELSRYLPLSYFKSRSRFSKEQSFDLSNLPNNVEVIPLPLWYFPVKSKYFVVGKKHAKAALKMIKRKNITFDLIHSHFLWSAGYAAMKVKEQYNKPLVVTGHGYDIYDLPYRDERLKEGIQEVLKSADRVLTVSKKNRKDIKRLDEEKRVEVFPNGYSSSLFYHIDKEASRKKLDVAINKKVLLTVGSLETVKGYEYLVKAIMIVKEKYPDVLLVHIGGGSLEKKLKEMIKELGLEKNIILLGRKPHSELVDYLGACDMFVSSSLSEGNPTVMFESLACGKPFVGTQVGGIPDVITSEKYGYLCEPKDEKALANNILQAIDTQWDSKEILEYAKQFSWENICKSILDIYREVLK